MTESVFEVKIFFKHNKDEIIDFITKAIEDRFIDRFIPGTDFQVECVDYVED